jgi:hypothetical protein
MDLKNTNSNGENAAKRNLKSMQFIFLEMNKIEPQTRFKVFFQKEMPSLPVKHLYPYLSLH